MFDNSLLECKQFLIGHVFCRWREIRNDNTVTWLAFWNDPINQRDFKYVFLAASSSLKGQSDKEKYEKSRKLKVRKFVWFCVYGGFESATYSAAAKPSSPNYILNLQVHIIYFLVFHWQDHIHKIRDNYTKDFRSKDGTRRQIAVATYLIDKLALRAGNEKVGIIPTGTL